MPVRVELRGARQAIARLERERRRAEDMRRARVLIGSSLVYAYGIETGRTRTGRLARRVGGARMLARGLEQTRGEIGDAVRRAGRGGELPGRELLLALAYKVLGRAMALTPVVTGTLRRSLRVWERGR